MENRLEVRIGLLTKLVLLGTGLISCGFLPLTLWLVIHTKWPKTSDSSGIELRNGHLLPWAELAEVRRTRVVVRGLINVQPYEHRFGKTWVVISPGGLANGEAVVAGLRQVLGSRLDRA